MTTTTRRIAYLTLVTGALLASTLASPADAAPRVTYSLRVCASDQTPTTATITYAVGVGESIADSGRHTRWLGNGCWQRDVSAYSYDRASVQARASNPRAYLGCAVWVDGNRAAKHYAYGSCAVRDVHA